MWQACNPSAWSSLNWHWHSHTPVHSRRVQIKELEKQHLHCEALGLLPMALGSAYEIRKVAGDQGH